MLHIPCLKKCLHNNDPIEFHTVVFIYRTDVEFGKNESTWISGDELYSSVLLF